MSLRDVVIVSAVRTPIGRFMGALSTVSAIQLGAIALEGALNKAGIEPSAVDEVIMGNVLQAGLGQNPARQVALAAKLPVDTPAITINKVCGSGLKAIHLAWQSIVTGENEIVVAGGMESMSQAPYLLPKARAGFRMGDQTVVDSMIHDGLWCAFNDYHMGVTAENLCERYQLSREQLDAFALDSQQKAQAAIKAGRFRDELIAVEVQQRKGDPIIVDKDEHPKPDTTLDQLAQLRPVFKKEGSVTAGNASGINDGAAACVLMSKEKADSLGLKPLAIIRANAVVGVDPAVMGIGPVPAIEKVLKKAGLSLDEIDLFELNEAFAAQSLAVLSHFDVDPQKINVNGGAIALGHPIGASGTRILVTLLHELNRRKQRYGLAALCIGGGQGIATVVERMES